MKGTGSLTIQLLGRLEIRAGGTPIRVTGRHAQALLGLLAIHPRLRLRDTIAAELWPEADGPSASSLRQALWLIRTGFSSVGLAADDWIETDQDSLGLRRDVILDVDTDRFARLAARPVPRGPRGRPRALRRRPARGPRPRMLRRRARAAQRPVRGPARRRRRSSGSTAATSPGRVGPPPSCSARSPPRGGPRRPDRPLRPDRHAARRSSASTAASAGSSAPSCP